jgi:hypothetical protein
VEGCGALSETKPNVAVTRLIVRIEPLPSYRSASCNLSLLHVLYYGIPIVFLALKGAPRLDEP